MKKALSGLISSILLLSLFNIPTTQAIQYESTISSVVYIEVQDSTGEYYSGTGVVFSSDALILTAAHVVMDSATGKPSELINICTIENEYSLPDCHFAAGVLAYNENIDLAIIYPYYELDDEGKPIGDPIDTAETSQALNLPYVDFADYEPMLGDAVTILGFPGATNSFTVTLTSGNISNFVPYDENITFYYATDATINPGNSGGPVYDKDEKLIGIVSMVSTEGIGGNYGYVVSGDIILLWMLDLVEQGIMTESFVTEAFGNDYGSYDSIANEAEDVDWTQVQFEEEEIFKDVSTSTANSNAIWYLKTQQIISGYSDGTFRPENNLNRAELLKILIGGTGNTPSASDYKNCFSDVKTEWYAQYICYAKAQNWIQGYSDGRFKPEQNVSKAEAIKMLLEVMQIPLETPTAAPYQDVDTNQWFAPYINTAKNLYLLEEAGSSYWPGNDIRRGQISENMYRLLIQNDKINFNAAYYEFSCEFFRQGLTAPSDEATYLSGITFDNYFFPVNNDPIMENVMANFLNTAESTALAEQALADCGS